MSEYSPEREGLANLEDKISALTAAVIASTGTKPGRIKPAARPHTAAQELRFERRVTKHRSLVARVLPSD